MRFFLSNVSRNQLHRLCLRIRVSLMRICSQVVRQVSRDLRYRTFTRQLDTSAIDVHRAYGTERNDSLSITSATKMIRETSVNDSRNDSERSENVGRVSHTWLPFNAASFSFSGIFGRLVISSRKHSAGQLSSITSTDACTCV